MDLIIKKGKPVKEIKPFSESEDKGIVKTPDRGGVVIEREDHAKKSIALDTLFLGAKASAEIHGVSESSAYVYARGDRIKDPDMKTEVLSTRHGIESLALTKLMETLDLINPHAIEKETDKVKVVAGLGSVIDKITGGNKSEGTRVLHLELHMPVQKSEDKYETIEVTR